ncbi:tRNA (adenosine(37)-N6)-threonylcarbamoyltransferase complex ATPase subunit type 1 TsaE [Candidatus Parcubacteria bacterium]|nr:tRNA (adenosine(37)-N6)-threonylcarbamoyltransferase complex ATPase subunit type 1 TsaE [Candidatus Parcubacteria bacterium]
MEFISNSEQDTLRFARKYAKNLKPGQILGLIGCLGAGKTLFTKGLADGLGINQNISSPTFNLMRLYEINSPKTNKEIKKFCHIDAYRVENEYEVIDVGAEDYMGKADSVTIIEWADKIKDILPSRTIYINFEIKGNTKRKITITEPETKKKPRAKKNK